MPHGGSSPYLPEQVAFPKMLTGREVVRFYARLKGAPLEDVQAVLAKVDLIEAAEPSPWTPIPRACGSGSDWRRRWSAGPVCCCSTNPPPVSTRLSRQHFYELIAEVSRQGGSVLLSSHGLSELEARTDRVAILRKGELVADAPLATLQQQADLPIRIRVRAAADAIDKVHASIGGGRINCASLELLCARADKMRVLTTISALGALVEDIDVTSPTLDAIYRHFSKTGAGDAAREDL